MGAEIDSAPHYAKQTDEKTVMDAIQPKGELIFLEDRSIVEFYKSILKSSLPFIAQSYS